MFALQHRSVVHLDGTVSVELVRTDGGVHGAWVSEPSSDLGTVRVAVAHGDRMTREWKGGATAH